MLGEIKNLLIIANSARMLAQFANNIGCQTLCIDCFADNDTQSLALQLIKVENLTLDQVKPVFLALNKQYTITHFIYGTGLSAHIDTLKFLHQHLIALGNDLSVFSAIQNKTYFFSILNELNIPYPETVFQQPGGDKGWLLKPENGEGGLGIKEWDGLVKGNADSCYWQKHIAGTSMSVLFVANSQQFKIIGFQQQFVVHISDNPFVFLGVISQPKIGIKIQQLVSQWLEKLVPEFSLKGINSLDFIMNEQQCYMLEINTRPSASMQLYNENLLASHINCFLDGSLADVAVNKTYQAYQILFAKTVIEIEQNINWPSWVVDIPKTGSIIHTGMPICSIIAGDKNEQQVKDLLRSRQQIIKQLLPRNQ